MKNTVIQELLEKWKAEHGKFLLIGKEVEVTDLRDGDKKAYGCQIVWNMEENVVHYAIIGSEIDDGIYAIVDTIASEIEGQKNSIHVFSANAFISRNRNEFKDAVFSRKIFLICHTIFDQDGIISTLSKHNYRIEINDDLYYRERLTMNDVDVFLSHDSRDKDDIVRGLNNELSKRLVRTWLDENSLMVGDRLTTKINEGLAKCKYCVVILSKNFLENKGWCDREFRSIVTRELHEKRDILMPVWHKVSADDIIGYSLELKDRVGLNTDMGIEQLAEKIKRKVNDIRKKVKMAQQRIHTDSRVGIGDAMNYFVSAD